LTLPLGEAAGCCTLFTVVVFSNVQISSQI
jgi:hypothetical protein